MHIPEVLVPFMGGITYLPFVRDSKLAPTIVEKPLGTPATTATGGGGVGATEKKSEEKKADKPVAVAPTPAAAPASTDAAKTEAPTLTTTPAPAVAAVAEPLSPEAQAVADKIAATGEEIRKLKAAKVCHIYTHTHTPVYTHTEYLKFHVYSLSLGF